MYLATHRRVIGFSKPSRHSLGVRLENTLLEIIELGYLALGKQGTSRLMIISKLDIKLRIFFTHLRLAHQTRCLNDAGYAELSQHSVELGKMIGHWIKATKTALNAR
ncbi:four helix bundle protein [Patescibacteria group bacterium]|nr:MAG: four helix bundle protein [Patescibacteria group bacterium]